MLLQIKCKKNSNLYPGKEPHGQHHILIYLSKRSSFFKQSALTGQNLTEKCSETELDTCENRTPGTVETTQCGAPLEAPSALKLIHFWSYHSKIHQGRAKTIKNST